MWVVIATIVTLITFIIVLRDAIISHNKTMEGMIPEIIVVPGTKVERIHDTERSIMLQNIGGRACSFKCDQLSPATIESFGISPLSFIYDIRAQPTVMEYESIRGIKYYQNIKITAIPTTMPNVMPNVHLSEPIKVKSSNWLQRTFVALITLF